MRPSPLPTPFHPCTPAERSVESSEVAALTLSCDGCPMRATSACDDCIVPLLTAAAGPVGAGEARTLLALQAGGLAPGLGHPRHRRHLVALANSR